MKIKRKKLWLGALSTLAVATLSVATIGIGSVSADAEAVDFSKDATKWQTLTKMNVDATKGLVPTGATFRATTVEVGGNSSAEITTDFAEGTGHWGAMAYFLKWNEGTDAVDWQFTTENAQYPISDTNSTAGMNVTSASGDWIAVVVNTAWAPVVYQCENGTISRLGNLAENGSVWVDGNDFWYIFNQKSTITLSSTDTATGMDISISFDAVDVGKNETTFTYSSKNKNLRGAGAFSLAQVNSSATFSTGASTASVLVDDVASEFVPDEGVVDFATNSTKWKALNKMNVDASKGLVPVANGTSVPFSATSIEVGGNSSAEIMMNFAEGKQPTTGGNHGGAIVYFMKWNEGTDAVDWQFVTSNAQYPISSNSSYTTAGMNVTSASGDWVAVVVNTAWAPVVYQCEGGTISRVGNLAENGSAWVNGNDFWGLFNQTTKVKFSTTDTPNGVNISVSFDAIDIASAETTLTASLTNVGLRGSGSLLISGGLTGGTATFSTGASALSVLVKDVESDYEMFEENNMLLDGSFSSGDVTKYWNSGWKDSNAVNSIENGMLKIHNATEANQYVAQTVSLTKEGAYKLSADVKIENIANVTGLGEGAWVSVTKKNSSDKTVTIASDGYEGMTSEQTQLITGWNTISFSFTATETKEHKICFNLYGASGTLWVDNVVLEDITDVEEPKHWSTTASYPTDFSDGSFTLVGIGDPQNFAKRADASGSYYMDLYKWIADNKNTYNMKYVVNIGDTVDQCPDEGEWQIAAAAHKQLQDVELKYALTMGNHDYDGYWNLFKGLPMDRTATSFAKYFPYSTYESWLGTENFGVFDAGKMENSWHKFTNGNDKYLIVSLEYGVREDTITKAKALIDANPDYHVIITQHAYLNGDLSYNWNGYTDLEHDGALSPVQVWEKLISKCPNIFMVLAGHTVSYGVSTSVVYGDAGNPIIQMKIDAQGTFSDKETLIALYNIKGTSVQTYYYSVSSDRYYAGSNFSVAPMQGEAGEKGGIVKVKEGYSGDLLGFVSKDEVTPIVKNASSSNPNVATIDATTGKVTALGVGETTITYVLDGKRSIIATEGVLTGYTVTLVVEHDYEAVVTAPTCTEKGYTTYTCSVCGDSYVADEVPANGHDYEAVITEPTCTEDGYTTYTCSVCGDSYVDDEVPANGHDYEAVITEPTCTEKGYTTYTCSVCGDNYVADEVPASGHDYEAVITEPTCTEKGYTTYTCSVCGDSYKADEVAELGHTEVVDEAKAPTCTETGLTEGKHCSVCGEVLIAQEEVPANGHDYEAIVTAPTCTEKGYTTYTCSVCGDSYVADEVAELGHTEVVDEAKAPTCTETGLTEGKHCSACGEVLIAQEEVPANGHDYEAVVTEPTCTEKGYTTYTCSVCGDSYVADEVPANGHDYEAVVTEPTCTEDGYTTYTCSVCGDSYVADEVAELGHTE
ncbi:MAG: hypothetical protein E7368_02455, partial [Clostridiales bacterium]|nr:hypothetical protein [Clostridiales bacterium]